MDGNLDQYWIQSTADLLPYKTDYPNINPYPEAYKADPTMLAVLKYVDTNATALLSPSSINPNAVQGRPEIRSIFIFKMHKFQNIRIYLIIWHYCSRFSTSSVFIGCSQCQSSVWTNSGWVHLVSQGPPKSPICHSSISNHRRAGQSDYFKLHGLCSSWRGGSTKFCKSDHHNFHSRHWPPRQHTQGRIQRCQVWPFLSRQTRIGQNDLERNFTRLRSTHHN